MNENEYLERLKSIREALDFQYRFAKVCGATTVAVPIDHAATIYAALTYIIEKGEQK